MKAKNNEKIIVECKPHWIGIVIPGAIALLFFLISLTYLLDGSFSDFLIFFVIFAVFAGICYLSVKDASLIMTETAIIGKTGIIRTKQLTSPIQKVQDISVSNGLFGKIFKYYTITVATAGTAGTEYKFKHMKNGKALQDAFLAYYSNKGE